MGVYAVGIPGTVIAVFNAPSMREAKHYVHDQNGLADDLMVLQRVPIIVVRTPNV
jgi:hypothetical protein